MKNRKLVRSALCIGILGAALAAGGEAMIPEVTEMPGARKLLLSLVAEEGGNAFLVRSLGGEEQRVTRPLPSEGLDRYKLALISDADKEGTIHGYSVVTWKPAPEDEAVKRAWPELRDVAGATARIRAPILMVRRFEAPKDSAAKWGLEIVSFRKIEPKDEEDPIVRAKKEVIEEGGAQLIEDKRFTLFAPGNPGPDPRYGIRLTPVWKEEGKVLEGFDAQLVTTPAPAKATSE